MLYSIKINQAAIVKAGLNVDVVDMSIFDFIVFFAHHPKCMKVQANDGIYFWISHALIIENLPILGIGTSAGIIKRINKLIDAGLLVRHTDCDSMHKTFYKFGPNYERVIFDDTHNESSLPTTDVEGTHNKCLGSAHNDCLGKEHIEIEDNKSKDNIPADGGLFSSEPDFIPVTVTRPRRTAEPAACLFENSRFADYNAFAAEFTAPEFANVDIVYYFHAVADWSAQKGKKMKDWIATARNFIRGDMEKNKLHKIQQTAGPGGLSQDAIDYLKMNGKWDN